MAFGEMCVHVYQHSHLHSTPKLPAAPVWTIDVSLETTFRVCLLCFTKVTGLVLLGTAEGDLALVTNLWSTECQCLH